MGSRSRPRKRTSPSELSGTANGHTDSTGVSLRRHDVRRRQKLPGRLESSPHGKERRPRRIVVKRQRVPPAIGTQLSRSLALVKPPMRIGDTLVNTALTFGFGSIKSRQLL
jgi:hypothetical protein